MTQEIIKNLLVVGLAEAGKTSYIHAVDDLLQNPPNEESLKNNGLAKDRSFLERHKSKFRAGKPIGRTERDAQGAIPELLFEHPKSGIKGRLFLPDVDGEIFQDQWVNREWTESYRDALNDISGILLFVRADVPSSNQELLGMMIEKDKVSGKKTPWQPKKASAQVQLVDVLQFIASKRIHKYPLKLAILISAWDTVEKPANKQPKCPDAFLKREWALLDQYVRANREIFAANVYGVSALGGTEEELKVLNRLAPEDRVKIVEANHSSRDLTRPIRWLLQLD
jgi:hypothetical protein